MLAMSLLAACTTPHTPGTPAAHSAAQNATLASVNVEFDNPSEFTEVRSHPQQRERDNQVWMDSLREHLERNAPSHLPPRSHLLVRFTDVKLAGDYEPWRRPTWSDVRIVRDIYPPRLDLSYQLTDSQGQMLKQGISTLRDPAFLMRTRTYPEDPVGYEKRMLDDWLRREFGRSGEEPAS